MVRPLDMRVYGPPLGVVAGLAAFVVGRWACGDRICVRSHQETVPAWVEIQIVNNLPVPIWHAEQDITVCDQWGPR